MKLRELKKGDEVVVVWQDRLEIAKISKINSRTIVVDGIKYWAGCGKQQNLTTVWPYIRPLTPEWLEVVRLVALATNTLGYANMPWQWMHDAGKKLDDLQVLNNDLISLICDIRKAAGVDEKLMLSNLAECVANLKQGHDRYEKVRKLNAGQFAKLHHQNIHEGKRFDDLVDGL